MLHKLKLTNFKQHKSLIVDFSEGLNVIAGENGAGKSTIFKAILYALFGAAAAGQKSHLSTWGSDEKMEVSLHATIAGKTLIILRGVDKATIFEGDSLLASGHTPCTKFIEQELGLDAKTFKHLMYAAQGETQALLKMGAADLQRRIEVITKIDGIDSVIKLIGEDLIYANAQLSVLPAPANLVDIQDRLQQFDKEVIIKQSNLIEKEKMVAKTAATLRQEKERIQVISSELRQVSDFKIAEKVVQNSLAQVRLELDTLEQSRPPDTAAQLQADETSLTQYLARKQELVRNMAEVENSHKAAVKVVEQAEADLKEFKALEPKFTQRLALNEAVRIRSDELALAVDTQNRLDAIELECPTCNRAFDTASAADIKIKRIVANDNTRYAKEQHLFDFNTLCAFQNANPSLAKVDFEQELSRLQTKLDAAISQSTTIELRKWELSAKAGTYADNVQSLTDAKTNLIIVKGKLSIVAGWEQKFNSLVAQSARMTRELSALVAYTSDWTEEALAAMQQEVAELEEDLRISQEMLVTDKYSLKDCQFQLATCQDQFQVAQKTEATRKDVEKDVATRKELQVFLRNNRTRLTEEVWNAITTLTSGYASEITEGLIHSLTRDASGDFYVQEGEHTAPVSELSGAREAIVGLSLRIALGKAFYGDSSFIMLDEVTAACSENNAANVAGTLQGLGTQVIMISHRGADVANAANVIFLG